MLLSKILTFLCNQTLYGVRKHFCCYCWQLLITAQILKRHAKDCFEIYGKQIITMDKNGESPFMIYADFESILVSKNNGKQKLDQSYTNKYQHHVGCTFGYKLVCVDGQFSKRFKSYLGQDVAHTFLINVVKKSKN